MKLLWSAQLWLALSSCATTTNAFIPSSSLNAGGTRSMTHPLYASTLDGASTSNKNKNKKDDDDDNRSLGTRIANSGVASAAAMATAAVNAAVAMKTLEAPDVGKSYIAMDRNLTENTLDDEGLPLVYDKDLIEAYWSKERGALNQRWGFFVGKAVPFLTKLTTLFIRDGKIKDEQIPALSRQARLDLQELGPTFIKAGQMMSVRPDVLPQATLDELTLLQDAVAPFSTEIAVQQIEQELGGPLGQFFSSISEEPVAAASLAQVYKAYLRDGTPVAVKVQRPDVLGTVSKDLYVLRRAAEVWQGLIERFAPQQRTNYVALLNEWAIGFYTELDFNNEASNQRKLRSLLLDKNITKVTVPETYDELCTRRILVSEWIDGKKLTDCSPQEIAAVTPYAQEAFLTQLLEVGFFHSDAHGGNQLLLNEPREDGAVLALIDCGLMASIQEEDRDNMISAVIHLANKDYAALVDDFIKLKILPEDSDRPTIIPLMDKALSPYVQGGGAKKYEAELKRLYGMDETMQSQVGGFQAMTQDALTVLNEVPFSIPPYFAILGRAIVTLEGIALLGDPNYGIILESYPFIARKLLRGGRPEIQKALQEVLYSSNGDESSGLKLTRLLALLNNAAGSVATQDGAAFVDLDSVPEDGLSVSEGLRFVLSDQADSLRNLLEPEVDNVVDVLSRQVLRRAFDEGIVALTPPRPPSFLSNFVPTPPALDSVPIPMLLPRLDGSGGTPRPSLAYMTLAELKDIVAPKLTQDEEIYAIGLTEGAQEFLGKDIADVLKGTGTLRPQSIQVVLDALRSGAIGRSSVLSSASARSVMDFVSTALDRVSRSSASSSPASTSKALEAIEELSELERERLDDILEELTRRSIKRTLDRLENIDRIA